MEKTPVHTLIFGAGPAGLAAAYTLARAGKAPIVIEKAKVGGGLMRSLKTGDFIVDIGRKELYNRLGRVDDLWAELLGADFREYPHRGGILYEGNIIEISPSFRGFRRGMPVGLFLGCASDLVFARLRPNRTPPKTLEEYFYRTRGRRLTRIVSQGFQEKLAGTPWSEVKMPEDFKESSDASFFATVKGLMTRAFARKEVNTHKGIWRHPAKGTGQICDALEQGAKKHGATFLFDSSPLSLDAVDGKIRSVTVETGGQTRIFEPEHVISSIPAHLLLKLLLKEKFSQLDPSVQAPPSSKRTIVLTYLFIDEPPRFPHAWLNVTCPQTRIGRITNYTGINGDMVPPGKTCLCCEFFCYEGDPILKLDDAAVAALAKSDCAKFKLIDPTKVFDHKVLRLPGADASQNRHNWMNNLRSGLLLELKSYSNLYYATRTDLDIATLAGIESAEAVLTGDRTLFDQHIDPKNLPIRSTKKAFEFRNPAG